MNNMVKNGASILGLQSVLSKKQPRRDLDELASKDLASGVDYPTPANAQTIVSATDNSEPSVTAKVGITNTTGKMRLPDGSMVRFERRLIAGDDLKRVTIYKGNPRATTNPDVTALRAKVAQTGGNIIPVTARDLPNGEIEVIAGSRRTTAVKAEELALLADVIIEPVSEVNARTLAYVENDGREDPDVFDEAAFFSSTYETYKLAGLATTVESFGKIFSMSKVNMGRYLNIATIPNWLYMLCPRSITDVQGAVKSNWSLRKADELYVFYKDHADRIDGEIKGVVTQHQCSNPDDIIRVLKKTLDKPMILSQKTPLRTAGKEVGYYESGKRKNTLKIFLSEDAPENVVNEIKRLLDSLNS